MSKDDEDLESNIEFTISVRAEDMMDTILDKSIKDFDSDYLEYCIGVFENELENRIVKKKVN